MNDTRDLDTLEERAYRGSYSDGIIDIFVGLSLAWIGATWIWLPDLAGLAGVVPAVFVAPMLEGRKRFVEERAGYVKWGEPRRRWERRNLLVVLAGGVGLLFAGVGAFAAVSADTDLVGALAPGLLAWLLALLALTLAWLMETRRMLVYAGVLTLAGVATAWAEANPGWPLLVAGIAICVTGIPMLARFLRATPVMEAQ